MKTRGVKYLGVGGHAVGVFTGVGASVLCGWLARHRGRLRILLFGGKKLSVLVIYDREGSRELPAITLEEAEAVRVLATGPAYDPTMN